MPVDIGSSGVWTFNAVASTVLQDTGLQLTLNDLDVKYAEGPVVKPTHDAAYWERATRGFDFSDADRVPPGLFNKVLWKGLMGDKPYPVIHSAFKATEAAERVRDGRWWQVIAITGLTVVPSRHQKLCF